MSEDFNLAEFAGTVTSETPIYEVLNKDTRGDFMVKIDGIRGRLLEQKRL